MTILKQLFGFVFIATALFVLGSPSEAQTYGGYGRGVNATVNNGTATNYVFADTGQLPPNGGSVSASAQSSLVPSVMSTGVLTANSSGALRSSQSVTVANDVDIFVGGLRIRANRVIANSGCICCPGVGDGTCGGSTLINGLTITDRAGNITNVNATGEANQVVVLPDGVGTITLNQQVIGVGSITVNGLRVDASANGTTYALIVATASSRIECLTTGTTPADVTLSGRVLDRAGRPISRATVTLTDEDGNARSVVTNTFGQYSFEELEAGESYVLQASHRSYSFSAQVITAEDDMTVHMRAN